jgi:DNA-binding MarR family transcriptional regulator
MSGAPHDARLVADAVEGVIAARTRQRRPTGDPEPGALSLFQSLALSALADHGPVRLGSLADTLGTTDATASRTVDVLESLGLAERRPDPDDARGVIVAATPAGMAEVRRRRRQLERLAARALSGLTPDESQRVVHALAELRVLLDRRGTARRPSASGARR